MLFDMVDYTNARVYKRLKNLFRKTVDSAFGQKVPEAPERTNDRSVLSYGGYITIARDGATKKTLVDCVSTIADNAIKTMCEVGGEIVSAGLIMKEADMYIYLDENGEVCDGDESVGIEIIPVYTVGWKANIRGVNKEE